MDQQNSKKITLNEDISKVYNKLSRKKWWVVFATFVITAILMFVNLATGSSNSNIIELLTEAIANPNSQAFLIIINLRLPHVLCSLIAGAALGICGCILQSSLSNPLAAPSTIGVSQGASCGACIAIICLGGIVANSSVFVVVFAFIFALIPTLLIFCISKLKNFGPTTIILSGIAMAIFFGGLVALVEYFADSTKVAEVVFWTFGSVHNASYSAIGFMAIMLLIVCIYSFANSLNFNALECGDITAHSVGVNVLNARLRHLLVAAIISGCVTAFCGTINFIGLIAPHIMRRFVGSNYKFLLPTSALCGGAILSLSDILSSAILPGVILPIGAITSFIGAPIFIWILLKRNTNGS